MAEFSQVRCSTVYSAHEELNAYGIIYVLQILQDHFWMHFRVDSFSYLL